MQERLDDVNAPAGVAQICGTEPLQEPNHGIPVKLNSVEPLFRKRICQRSLFRLQLQEMGFQAFGYQSAIYDTHGVLDRHVDLLYALLQIGNRAACLLGSLPCHKVVRE